jgi:hypothetical protein
MECESMNCIDWLRGEFSGGIFISREWAIGVKITEYFLTNWMISRGLLKEESELSSFD